MVAGVVEGVVVVVEGVGVGAVGGVIVEVVSGGGVGTGIDTDEGGLGGGYAVVSVLVV